MELNPNFIQHLDVESLLTLFVENFFSSMRGGNTDTPMMLDLCLCFPWCINELLKRVTGTSYRYFTNPVASYYLQPTLGDVDINFCDLAKLPKPLSGCLSKKQLDEIRQWVQQYGKSVRQNTTRNFSTKDKPGTLPLNLYESAPPEQHSVDFDVLLNEDIPVQHQDTSTARNIVIAQSTYVVVSRIYKPRSAPNSPLYITKLLEDVVDDYDSARHVTTLCYTQDVVDPLLFTTSGEEHVIPKGGIKGVVSSITVVDNETVEIDEGDYYLLLALGNESTDTTSPNSMKLIKNLLQRVLMDKVTRIRSKWTLADRKGSGRGQWPRSFSFIKIAKTRKGKVTLSIPSTRDFSPFAQTESLFTGYFFWVPKPGFNVHSGDTSALKNWFITKDRCNIDKLIMIFYTLSSCLK